jgi:carboxypeptidase Taq
MTNPVSAPNSSYANLERRFAQLSRLQDIAAMLQWDSAAMMPPGGAEARAEQLAMLKVMAHELLTEPAVGDWLAGAESETGGLNEWQRANLHEMRRSYLRATAVPADLISAISLACSRCETVWRKARAASDFAMVLPFAEEQLRLIREQAQALGSALDLSPYDALLDGYEPDGRSAEIDVIFDDLAQFLPGFIEQALAHQAKKPVPQKPAGPFPVEAQRQLGIKLMGTLGFDFDRGRLDTSLHPFCGGISDDVRITTRYDERDFMPALMGVIHETGHALYEQGLPVSWRQQPVGQARGMSVHESQSLLAEMQAGRSREFLSFAAPLMREAFGGSGPAWELDNIQRVYTRVARGFIRVDADEATYPAHVILRYRLERALIAGEMTLKDLPSAWNDGMKQLLGIVPPNDAEGCLQDIHWYDGAWGYFPTYTLGAMTAAQLFAAAETARPTLRADLAKGDFTGLVDWLRNKIHGKASSRSTQQLLIEATGRPLDASLFKAHLSHRYLS